MAKLTKLDGTSVEGQAHIEVEGDPSKWGGWMIFLPELRNDAGARFDEDGLSSNARYEGTAIKDGQYFVVRGRVKIRKVSLVPEYRVEFVGVESVMFVSGLSQAPDDFLT